MDLMWQRRWSQDHKFLVARGCYRAPFQANIDVGRVGTTAILQRVHVFDGKGAARDIHAPHLLLWLTDTKLLLLGRINTEILTNPPDKVRLDFVMFRNSAPRSGFGVYKYGVVCAFSQKCAFPRPQVLLKVRTLHEAMRIGSIISTGHFSSGSVWSIKDSASLRFSRASSRVSPCVLTPLTSRIQATQPPSTCLYTAVKVCSTSSIIEDEPSYSTVRQDRSGSASWCESRISDKASRRFSRASFSERPWLMAPGTSSTRATHQPSHRRYTAVNDRSMIAIMGQSDRCPGVLR